MSLTTFSAASILVFSALVQPISSAVIPKQMGGNPYEFLLGDNRNLFKEYMARSLHKCASDYLEVMRSISALTRVEPETRQAELQIPIDLYQKAVSNYAKCQWQLRNTEKTYDETPFSSLNEVLQKWKADDATEEKKVQDA